MTNLATPDPLGAIGEFAALLREQGFPVGVAEHADMLRSASLLGLQPRRVGEAWRSLACQSPRDWQRWPEVFERFWYPQRARGSTRVSGQTRPARDLRQIVTEMQQGMASAPSPGRNLNSALDAEAPEVDDAPLTRSQGGASRTEALHDRSLQEWLPQDLSLLQQLAEAIARRLRHQLTRRQQASPHGRRLDLRRTLRQSLATGGVPLHPAWREPRRERPPLFILVDVSRSMETHAQLFLRIARAFVLAAQARVFVFHTRLAEVTPLLQRDSAAVQEKVNAVTAGFGGGTRIATSVNDFVRVHAKSQLRRRARVWVLSDGFDADPPEALAESLAALVRRRARITWFHPAPLPPASSCMATAAPLVARFVRLASLRDLAQAATLLE